MPSGYGFYTCEVSRYEESRAKIVTKIGKKRDVDSVKPTTCGQTIMNIANLWWITPLTTGLATRWITITLLSPLSFSTRGTPSVSRKRRDDKALCFHFLVSYHIFHALGISLSESSPYRCLTPSFSLISSCLCDYRPDGLSRWPWKAGNLLLGTVVARPSYT